MSILISEQAQEQVEAGSAQLQQSLCTPAIATSQRSF